jgi:hypothetical protein
MVSDRIYELCQPVLDDDDLGDEEKTDKLEEQRACIAQGQGTGRCCTRSTVEVEGRKGQDHESSDDAWREPHSLPLASSLATTFGYTFERWLATA